MMFCIFLEYIIRLKPFPVAYIRYLNKKTMVHHQVCHQFQFDFNPWLKISQNDNLVFFPLIWIKLENVKFHGESTGLLLVDTI